MDDVAILKETLENTIARNARANQNYEIEIANLTSRIIALEAKLKELLPPEEAEEAIKSDS